LNKTLHEIHNWEGILGSEATEVAAAGWMGTMLGVPEEDKTE